MEEQNIRWRQRLNSFSKALDLLNKAVEKSVTIGLNDLEEQGLIQGFEFTYEIAWNLLKDYLQHQGNQDIAGSRDAFRAGFKAGLIEDGEGWMEMIKSRNQSAHTYDEEVADAIADQVVRRYTPLFNTLLQKFQSLSNDDR